ncbi:hypothetical protein DPMN_130351 [Dreissena polymorpha]|uniref:Uncharacterized protein n=1 Tax=Dreissena polymorpha TaxID=45954 RepID=A0A9D4K1R1_DREPO|nr:hypothetical protein DPMN_130331 [Dreissena polymorpha]KAH3828393.1 hypothetical protein DPMN_130351 [Dreissena polymorpha]
MRQSPDATRKLHGSSKTVLSSRIVMDQHGVFELPKTAVLASRSAKDIPGCPRTYTAARRFTCRIIPDMIRAEPAFVWDWCFTGQF